MTNAEIRMTKDFSYSPPAKRVYDLSERTREFGAGVISLSKRIREIAVTRPLISQLVRAGTSVGANYCEADDSSTKRDFFCVELVYLVKNRKKRCIGYISSLR